MVRIKQSVSPRSAAPRTKGMISPRLRRPAACVRAYQLIKAAAKPFSLMPIHMPPEGSRGKMARCLPHVSVRGG